MSLKEKMTALADAVREKAELTDTLTIDEMTEAVSGLVVNGVDVDEQTLTVTPSKSQQNFTSSELGENAYYGTVTVNAIPDEYITTTDATAVSGDILYMKTAYVNGKKVTGNMTNYGDVEKQFPNTRDTLSINANGYFKTIKVNLVRKTLEVTPTKSAQTLRASYEGSDVFYTQVNVAPIPPEYIITTDATATSGSIIEGETAYVKGEKVTGKYIPVNEDDVRAGVSYGYNPAAGVQNGTFTSDATALAAHILEGKTAYVNGEKVTGTLQSVTATLSGNVVTIPQGVIAEEQTLTVPEAQAPTLSENTVTVHPGYVRETQTVTVGTAKEAETFTPGTSDITIPADSYLTGAQVIMGDSALIPENIKTGVSIFTVEGTFTSDADATASDIAKGKTAYVKGEKITGTASGGNVVKWWRSINSGEDHLSTYVFSAGEMSVPASTGQYTFATVDGKLLYHNGNTIKYADSSIKWKYAVTESSYGTWCEAISDDGKLYYIQNDKTNANGELIATRICENVEGITQVMIRAMNDKALVVANGYLYLTNVTQPGNYAQVQYEKENADDPTVYVTASNVLNYSQYSNWETAYIITGDGSLAKVWKDGYEGTVGNAFAKIHDNDRANGNPFLNYNPQTSDYGGEGYSKTYELAFRSDGLWYREPSYECLPWNKADDPGLIKTNFLGYCSSYIQENDNYNEETGEVEWSYSFAESTVALHIDTQGRLWKIAVAGTASGNSYQFTGVSITQIGEDSDWQCVPPSIMSGKSNIFAQKGGKLVRLYTAKDADGKIVLNWRGFPYSPNGRMISNSNNVDLFFAPEGVTVDLSKPGGTY